MTLPLDAYVQLMGRKGTSEKEASEHYARIQKLLNVRQARSAFTRSRRCRRRRLLVGLRAIEAVFEERL